MQWHQIRQDTNLILCVKELGPLLVLNRASLRTPVHSIILGRVHQLQNKWPPCHNTRPSRKDRPTHQGLNHRTLARTLRTHDHNLWQLDGVSPNGVEDILELVDDRDEGLHDGGTLIDSAAASASGACAGRF